VTKDVLGVTLGLSYADSDLDSDTECGAPFQCDGQVVLQRLQGVLSGRENRPMKLVSAIIKPFSSMTSARRSQSSA